MDNSKKQSVGAGFLILSAASIAVKLMSLVFVPVIRSCLGGDAGYSVYSTAYSVYAFIYVLTTAGFPVAISKLVTELTVTKHSEEAEKAFKTARTFLIIIGAFFMALMGIFAKPIARFMNNEESWAGILCIAPTLLICAILSAYRGYFQGRKNMIPTASSQIIEQIVHVAVSILLVVLLKSKGIIWAVAGASIGTAVGALVALLIVMYFYGKNKPNVNAVIISERDLREKEGILPVSTSSIIKKIFYYSLPITLSSAVQYGGDLIDNKMIKSRLLDAGFAEFESKSMHGAFMAMRQLINVPVALVTALCISVLPAVASAYAVKNIKKVSERAEYGFKLCYTVSIPVIAAMIAFAQPIYKLLGYGSTNYPLLMAAAGSVLLLGTMHLQSSVLQGVNRMFTSSVFLCLCVVIKAVSNYFLVVIPGINVYGAVIATYISYLIPVLLNHYVISKKERIKISFMKIIYRPVAASVAMIIVSLPIYLLLRFLLGLIGDGYFMTLIAFVPTVLAAVAVYFYVMRKMGALTDDELDEISPKITKLLKRVHLIR
ncbi:MAG: polysaccharide biosynthesis protein [Clostridia bacterium]|nr:polysaccharide biosynthesis protein [Clostridia bacterium]